MNKVHSIRRLSVHPVNRSRHVHGEYHHLIPVLLDDPFKFAEYLRMNPDTFQDLLDECAAELRKEYTNYRQPCQRYKAASELRRSVSRRPCCAFVLVKEKQCTIKVSKRLKSSVP